MKKQIAKLVNTDKNLYDVIKTKNKRNITYEIKGNYIYVFEDNSNIINERGKQKRK